MSLFSGGTEQFLDRLRELNTIRNDEWTKGEDTSALFRAVELGGEVGELLNCIKKLERAERGWVGSKTTYEEVADEIADVQICLDRIAEYFSINIEDATRAKFNKTSEKYGLETKF